MGVSTNFNMFCDELKISSKKESIIALRYTSINKRLNNDFWNLDTNYRGVYIGCYGKETINDDVKEIDMIFAMPPYLQEKYTCDTKNGQLEFLEVVRASISSIYPKTSINKKKQTIKVSFADGMCFEVLPVFVQDTEVYTCPEIKNGGCWVSKNLISDIQQITIADAASNNSLRKLAKMTKAWKQKCDVNIKDSLIDTLVYNFIKDSHYRYDSYASFDIMCLNFFKHLMEQSRSKKEWIAIDGGYQISNPNKFRYKAVIAYYKAKTAIKLVADGKKWAAAQKWREIFGDKFPELIVVESQLKKIVEKTTSIYNIQKQCAKILNRHIRIFRNFQLITIVMLLISLFLIINNQYINIAISLFTASSLIFVIHLYFKKYNLVGIASKHLKSASEMFLIREEYQNILRDFTEKHVDINIIRDRKDDLLKNRRPIYKGTSRYLNKKYFTNIKVLHKLSNKKEKTVLKDTRTYSIPVRQGLDFQKRINFIVL